MEERGTVCVLVLSLAVLVGGGRGEREMGMRAWTATEEARMPPMAGRVLSGGFRAAIHGGWLAGGALLLKEERILRLRGGKEEEEEEEEGRGRKGLRVSSPRKKARNAGKSSGREDMFLSAPIMDDLVEQMGKLTFSFRVNDKAEVFQANITEDFNETFVQKMLDSTNCVNPDNEDEALKSTEILLFISVSENLTEKDGETSFKVFSCDSEGNAKDVVIRHSAKEDRLRSIRDEIRNVSGHSHQDMSCQVDTVQDCSKELEKFVHPSYLAANSQTNIKKFFARDSAVQLHDFLTTSLYDEIWKGWELLPWRKAGPRNKKNHHQIDNEELQGMLMSKEVIGSSDGKNGQDIEIRALIRTFASQDFRQFLQGCYAMNHPSDDSNAVGVLEVVFVSADRGRTSSTQGGYDYKGWLQGHGGDLIYTTKDVEETNIFESEIEVCSIPPHGNTLSVVMMEEASQASSHVRYINQMAGDKCRHDILVRYKIVESGDEMSFESSEDREIESEEESFVPEDATIVHFRPALDGSHNITRSS
ncbi:hypothetical protein GUITHDRAFT_145303 [Guillardia theta CCMP2712]|uniref:Oxoglutarate/iron-dependent oxygenase C-terminal degradation domain-containing protein n=1 Tax=Guillardia theta (strain CCMP2712) TaxID=905079 RepID=L1ILR0_GUITC|nr:hypothetical protein GUITHDRAFT_145303 [Guillardia theta CCMP2712]EKX37062.1 hypothetical protein GUITHDRAFT_145303 [Guillardia theta CCMP2712]|eukprot:XP_005824042.1 hypothetical protein GUITHDRAFT_145303 [Guillardia theta CCMP2712]